MRHMLDLFPEGRIRPDPLPYNMLRQTKGMQGDGDMAGATEMTEAGAPGAGPRYSQAPARASADMATRKPSA